MRTQKRPATFPNSGRMHPEKACYLPKQRQDAPTKGLLPSQTAAGCTHKRPATFPNTVFSSSPLLSKYIKIKIYRNIILHIVLCGCETGWVTLREAQRLRAFEYRVLRKILGA